MITALVALVYASAASFLDYRYKVVPNDLTLAAAGCAVALAIAKGANLAEFALFGALWLCFSYLLYAARVWGGGDAKFFFALSLYAFLLKGVAIDGVLYWFLGSAGLLLAFALLANAREARALLSREWRARSLEAARSAFESAGLLSAAAFVSGAFPSSVAAFAIAAVSWVLKLPLILTAILLAFGAWYSLEGVLSWLLIYCVGFAGLELFSVLREIAKSKKGRFKGALSFAPFASIAFAFWVLFA